MRLLLLNGKIYIVILLFFTIMKLSKSEILILHKFYDICLGELDAQIYCGYFYDLMSKNYLWNTIKVMERKKLVEHFFEGRKKYITLTKNGIRICRALDIIRRI